MREAEASHQPGRAVPDGPERVARDERFSDPLPSAPRRQNPMSLLRASSRTLRSPTAFQPHVARVLQQRTLGTASAPARSPLRTGLYAAALTVSTGVFLVYYFDARSALHRYVVTPAIRNFLDAETGQKVAVKVLRSGLGPRDPVLDDEVLKAEVCLNIAFFFY